MAEFFEVASKRAVRSISSHSAWVGPTCPYNGSDLLALDKIVIANHRDHRCKFAASQKSTEHSESLPLLQVRQVFPAPLELVTQPVGCSEHHLALSVSRAECSLLLQIERLQGTKSAEWEAKNVSLACLEV